MPVLASPVPAPPAAPPAVPRAVARGPAPSAVSAVPVGAAAVVAAMMVLAGCSSGGGAGAGGGSGAGGGAGDGPGTGPREPVSLGAALPDTPGVQFAATGVTVSEANRHVPVQVVRTGPGVGRTVVRYLISGGSATPGLDLASVQGQLVWEDGQSGARTLDLQVYSDVESEREESVELSLEPLEGDPVTGTGVTIAVQDAPCTATVPLVVATDLLLDAPCYRLSADVEVVGGARLSIAAGTTLLADAGVALTVRDGAALRAVGEALVPVTLSGTEAQPGWWRGVVIDSEAVSHRWDEVRLRDARIGLDVSPDTVLESVSGGAIGNVSGPAARVPLATVAAFDGSTGFDRPAGVTLTGGRLERGESLSLPALSTHYVLADGLLVSGTLAVQAGAELRFAPASRLLVDADGTLQALGTAAAPVVLRGVTFEPGSWAGVQLLDSAGGNRLEHAVITNGGSDATRDGNLSLSGQATRLRAADLTLAGSAGVGLWLDTRLPNVTLARIGFAENVLAQARQGAASGDLEGL